MLVVSHESNEVTVLLRENRREDNPGLQIHMNRKNFFRRSVTPFFSFFFVLSRSLFDGHTGCRRVC